MFWNNPFPVPTPHPSDPTITLQINRRPVIMGNTAVRPLAETALQNTQLARSNLHERKLQELLKDNPNDRMIAACDADIARLDGRIDALIALERDRMVAEVAVERDRMVAEVAVERDRVALELARLAREPIVSPKEADMREHRHNRQDWGM